MFVIGDVTKITGEIQESTVGPVDVSLSEIKEFKQKNPDPILINSFAEKIKREHENYENFDYRPEIICVLYLKESHFDKISRYIKRATSICKYCSILSDANVYITDLLGAIDNNSVEIVNFLMSYLRPDFEIEEKKESITGNEIDQKVIFCGKRGKNISSILEEFGISHEIALDTQEIINKGFEPEIIGRMIIGLFGIFMKEKTKKKNEKKNFVVNEEDMDEFGEMD